MKISKINIKNYRNLKNVDLSLNRLVIFIGENNSGKSNILKAITLPFMNDEVGNISKKIGWQDINNDSKKIYFSFVQDNLGRIKNEEVTLEEFIAILPFVVVEMTFTPDGSDEFYARKWVNAIDGEEPNYSIKYKFEVSNPKKLLDHITMILKAEDAIDKIKMNLLPIDYYKYSITVTSTDEQVSFNDLSNYIYNSLAAERDEFSNKNTQLGSKALVNLLNNKLKEDQKVAIEKSYESFFSELKNISNIEGIFNWQEDSIIENAKDFFKEITLLPNMPSMNSLLNNVRLGFGEEYLNTQGLGHRNLIYLLVMINSLNVKNDVALNILTIEEPEAHLCISNEHLLASFINSAIQSSYQLQIFLSTHSTEFLNKLQLENVSVVNEGSAFSLKTSLGSEQLDYLAKKPNMDFIKFLFSRRIILVEGPSEEMLIKSYLSSLGNTLNDIEVISLHKGFTKMIEIWLEVNKESSHRLGVIRDFDNQPKAQADHERFNINNNVLITTTTEYTLEPEFVKTGDNYLKLKSYFETNEGWKNINSADELAEKWKTAKTDTMLKFCRDFGKGELTDIVLPNHIAKVLKFLKSGEKS
ncbi:ATP-dependent nuclease [Cohnella cholangitidis]|uniref:AAA family ATPase n=1 Tax=Cohnella cholangitidis TaxID=2598458 RepID=A0A7G5C471_9BACL|nr:AAA family ATPase [Cohnella cholangitidis]QMV44005.1 AAA family ATPase [Cohnella cholangitidis]